MNFFAHFSCLHELNSCEQSSNDRCNKPNGVLLWVTQVKLISNFSRWQKGVLDYDDPDKRSEDGCPINQRQSLFQPDVRYHSRKHRVRPIYHCCFRKISILYSEKVSTNAYKSCNISKDESISQSLRNSIRIFIYYSHHEILNYSHDQILPIGNLIGWNQRVLVKKL